MSLKLILFGYMQEWIEETCQFIEEEKFIFPFNSETEERFLNELEFAILHARLEDVMKKGTGLRAEITLPSMHTTLKGPVILELVHMTEVGVSAFALEKTRIDRDKVMHSHLYKAGQRGLEVGLVELMELDSKLPKYPRKSLKYWFTDGEMEIQAMEYKALPFTLGKAPIGIKVRFENVPIIGGVAYLEPDNIEVLGGNAGNVDEVKQKHLARLRFEFVTRMRGELYEAKVRTLSRPHTALAIY
ncbi:hypothetical protein D9611_011102 [Ephemerocybe angulata]|uniref:RecQ-mediated genome instability protein 1 n=1 Tax=Ephemerocybe angulata TaxID=980116 RepID=A0A8H5BAU0_9AGAR|nr:hypothetical protein D9611_011102 [Tulosesus angulatus]